MSLEILYIFFIRKGPQLPNKYKGVTRGHLKKFGFRWWKIRQSVKNSGKKIQGLPRALRKTQFWGVENLAEFLKF